MTFTIVLKPSRPNWPRKQLFRCVEAATAEKAEERFIHTLGKHYDDYLIHEVRMGQNFAKS